GRHDSGVHSRTTWNSGIDLRGRDFGCLVTRSAEAPCQPAGGLRSAQERADEGWQPERSGGCRQFGGAATHQPNHAVYRDPEKATRRLRVCFTPKNEENSSAKCLPFF